METTPRELDALLAQAGWAKALARSLVRDPDHAEDLVQRAWLAALRHPPAETTPPRRWLATVLRNFARDDAREESSRAHRERTVARPDRAPGMDPIEDAASAQARLLAAVRELPEPSRSTVWARYYDGLAPREIAARDGVPVDTVKTRLARGLDALRKRFDREHGGDRGAWVLAFLPLAGAPTVAPNMLQPAAPGVPLVTTLTTLAMDAKLKIAAVLAVAVCGAGLWVATRSDGISSGESAFAAPLASEIEAVPVRAEHVIPVERVGDTRIAIDAPKAEPARPAPLIGGLRDGIVVDLEQRAVAGLEIVERSAQRPILVDGQSITSDARGRFQVPVERVGQLAARGVGWVTVFATLGDHDDGLIVVVAREREIAGTVVDAEGAPVANVVVAYHVDESTRRALGGSLRASIELAFEARTDEHGRFTLPDGPDGVGTVHARAENRRSGSTSVAPGPAMDVVVVLPPHEEGSIFLRGRVVDASGQSADGATVGLADVSAKSDAAGRFELPVSRAVLEAAQRTTRDGHPPVDPMPLVLRALKVGHLPATLVLPALDELERSAGIEEFRLQLGSAPLSISGRVLDSEGQPIHGARVELLDEEPFGALPFDMAGMSVSLPVSIEQFLRGGFTHAPESTAIDGSFTIPGLQDRAYRIGVEVPSIPAALETEPIQAGRKDVEIRLDTSGARVDLAGRVVDGRGADLSGVVLRLHALANGASDYVGGEIRVTDAAGRFTFPGVRGERFRLEAIGGDAQPATIDVPEGTPLDDVLVSLTRLAFVQVDLGDRPEMADTAKFLDARGQEVEFRIMRSTESGDAETSIIWGSSAMTLNGGRSEVGSTAEGEYVCVLEKDGAEVARIPVSLGGVDVTIVRP